MSPLAPGCHELSASQHPWLALIYAGLLGGSWRLFALLVPKADRDAFSAL